MIFALVFSVAVAVTRFFDPKLVVNHQAIARP